MSMTPYFWLGPDSHKGLIRPCPAVRYRTVLDGISDRSWGNPPIFNGGRSHTSHGTFQFHCGVYTADAPVGSFVIVSSKPFCASSLALTMYWPRHSRRTVRLQRSMYALYFGSLALICTSRLPCVSAQEARVPLVYSLPLHLRNDADLEAMTTCAALK